MTDETITRPLPPCTTQELATYATWMNNQLAIVERNSLACGGKLAAVATLKSAHSVMLQRANILFQLARSWHPDDHNKLRAVKVKFTAIQESLDTLQTRVILYMCDENINLDEKT